MGLSDRPTWRDRREPAAARPAGGQRLSRTRAAAERRGESHLTCTVGDTSAEGRLITMSATIAATKLMAAAITNAWWYPAITAPAPRGRDVLATDPATVTRRESPTASPA